MKMLNKKFIASAVLAGLLATSLAVSASATNYQIPPVYNPVETNPTNNDNNNDNTADEQDGNESTAPTVVVSDSDVEAAAASGEVIEVTADENGDAVVSAAAIGLIAGLDDPVTFEVEDDGSDTDYFITIDPDDIKEVGDINLAMNIQILNSEEDVSDIEVPAGSIVIAPAMKGDFGLTLVITIPAEALEGLDLEAAELYYISDDGEVSLVPGGLVINDDGSASIAISHASEYVISDVDLTAEGGDIADDDDEDDDDDDDGAIIDDDDDDNATGKDDASVIVNDGGNGSDSNPVTGTTIALGSLAVFAAAAIATSKKRK